MMRAQAIVQHPPDVEQHEEQNTKCRELGEAIHRPFLHNAYRTILNPRQPNLKSSWLAMTTLLIPSLQCPSPAQAGEGGAACHPACRDG